MSRILHHINIYPSALLSFSSTEHILHLSKTQSKLARTYTLETTKQQKQAARFIQELIKACWKSKRFKRKLISAPIKTIEKITGKKSQLPKGVQIQVEDQSEPAIIYLNIPAEPK